MYKWDFNDLIRQWRMLLTLAFRIINMFYWIKVIRLD